MLDNVGGRRILDGIYHVSNTPHFYNCISVDGTVAGYVANGPNSLLNNFFALRSE